MANSDIDKDLTRTQDDVKIWPLATVPVQLSRLHERSPSGTTSPHSAALNSQVMAMADGSGFQKLTRKVMPWVLPETKTQAHQWGIRSEGWRSKRNRTAIRKDSSARVVE